MQNNYPGVLHAGSWIVPEELFYKQKFIISEYIFSQGPIISNGLLHKQKLVLLIFVCLFGFFVLMQLGCSYGGWRNIKD